MNGPANTPSFALPSFASPIRVLRLQMLFLAIYLASFAALQVDYQAAGAGATVASIILLAPPLLRRRNSLLFRALVGLPLYLPMFFIAVSTTYVSDMVIFAILGLFFLVWSLVLLRDGHVEVTVRDVGIRSPLSRKTLSLDEIASVSPNRPLTGPLLRFFGFREATTVVEMESWARQRTLGLRHSRIALKVEPERQEEFMAEVESMLMPSPVEGALFA